MSVTGEIDISKLNTQQLEQLHKQTEAEVKNLTMSLQQLRVAQARFLESSNSLSAIPADGEGKEVLVPLTQSLYVPGTIGSSQEVLVDVGTGFYVGKPLPDAAALMKKRAEQVGSEVSSLQRVVTIKQSNLEILSQALEQRIAIAERIAAENGGAGGAGGATAAAR